MDSKVEIAVGELRATFLGNWALRVWRKATAGERGLGWGARDRRTRPGLGSEGLANEAWAGERGIGKRGLGVAGYGRPERPERPDSVLSSPARQDGTGTCDGRLPERVAARVAVTVTKLLTAVSRSLSPGELPRPRRGECGSAPRRPWCRGRPRGAGRPRPRCSAWARRWRRRPGRPRARGPAQPGR